MSDFIYTFDLDGRFTYANPALHRLLEMEPGEMAGLNFYELGYPPDLAATLQFQIQEVISSGKRLEAQTHFESASGLGFYEYIFVPIFDEVQGITGVAGTTRDITKRKEIELALMESQLEVKSEQEKLRNLFNQAPAFIAVLDGPDFIFSFANEDYCKLVGRQDILGKPVRVVLPEVVSQGYVDLLKGVFTTGTSFIGRGMAVVLENSGQKDEHYVDFIYQAMRDASGDIKNVLVHGTDVTEQVLSRQKIERLNAELETRVKERTVELTRANHDLDGFTYSVSHDLRAPLRAIISSSRILLADYGDSLEKSAQEELERQASAATRLAHLIDDLLKLSRLSRHKLHKEPVNISALAETITQTLHPEKNCMYDIAPGMNVVADRTCILQLLVNLMENAYKFSPTGGEIQIGFTKVPDNTVFWIRDQGIGFNMLFSHKIFLPFERLVLESEFRGRALGWQTLKSWLNFTAEKFGRRARPVKAQLSSSHSNRDRISCELSAFR